METWKPVPRASAAWDRRPDRFPACPVGQAPEPPCDVREEPRGPLAPAQTIVKMGSESAQCLPPRPVSELGGASSHGAPLSGFACLLQPASLPQHVRHSDADSAAGGAHSDMGAAGAREGRWSFLSCPLCGGLEHGGETWGPVRTRRGPPILRRGHSSESVPE